MVGDGNGQELNGQERNGNGMERNGNGTERERHGNQRISVLKKTFLFNKQFIDRYQDPDLNIVPLSIKNYKCGQSSHSRFSSFLCPFNPYNFELIDKSHCRCGSSLHRRITHSDCPLNLNLVRNSQTNKLNNLDDFNVIFFRLIDLSIEKTIDTEQLVLEFFFFNLS